MGELKKEVSTLGASLQSLSYIIMMLGSPFPIFVASAFLTGMGFTLQVSHCPKADDNEC